MSRQNKEKPNVIIDREDNSGFDVNWEQIEKDYITSERRRRHHHRHSHKHHTSTENEPAPVEKKKMSKKKKILITVLIVLLCLIILPLITFFVMRYIGSVKMMKHDNLNINVPADIDYSDGGQIIRYKGHTYQFNENLASILFMGIDNTELKENAVAGTAGQADALYLLTYDISNGKLKVLALNRDTMIDINLYDQARNYLGTESHQLCLAYSYGDGYSFSAEQQVNAVQRLIYNIPINAYYGIDLSAIPILNDDIGGVEVIPQYTFGSFTKGQPVTLKGGLTEEFVRSRDVSLLDDNLRRIECQKQYINAFANQLAPAVAKDFSLPLTLYRDSSKYTVSNIDITEIVFLASSLAMNYSGIEFFGMEGEYKMVEGDSSAEYFINQEAFFETILDIYYTRID